MGASFILDRLFGNNSAEVYFWPQRNGHKSCVTLRAPSDRIQFNNIKHERGSVLPNPSLTSLGQ